MNTSEYIEQFIDRLDAYGVVPVTPGEVGVIVTSFPIVGGGTGCIVLIVEDMVVRLTVRANVWVAEHLVVRGPEP